MMTMSISKIMMTLIIIISVKSTVIKPISVVQPLLVIPTKLGILLVVLVVLVMLIILLIVLVMLVMWTMWMVIKLSILSV